MSLPDSIAAPAPDWSGTALGACTAWPAGLRLTVDIMLNAPLPMLLQWDEQIMVYNDAYVELLGLPSLRAPGGDVPAMQPAAWSWNPAAIDHARQGHSASYRGQNLPVWRDHAYTHKLLDLYYTPVRDDQQVVRGILCALAPAQAAAAAAPGRALRLLVVEDNPDARYLVCETLRALGHEVEAAASGEEALPLLSSQQFDVLFTDVSLPGMSGVELARQSRQTHPHLELLFASGYGDELTRHLEFPARSLQKPYDIDLLQTALAQIAASVHAKPS